ncbi:glucose dehydrogenase [FAD, quinone]-like isoform X2 [Diabrotica virgifera virgifera]|uniref:Glucose dehydrogenase [FAD, quinone]-like n=1 Tax=Diabrotica virgifera virgifera TaxID=50390 RepID=A0ABM5JX40_DIAVI|nr:glucose dehydrogenase [FAD, quinone]-like isoform X2 [Diabrotica virgifera virgifera]
MILFKPVPLAVFALTFFSSKDFRATASDKVFDEVQYYEKLITDELQKALNYETPTNAKMYEPDDTTIRDFGTFDFIIIGAGSTGSVIASRLSEVSRWKILVLEAGHYPNNFTMIPGMFAIQAMTSYNWGFKSTPQKTACLGTVNQQCNTPAGKGMGGTSLISELVYARGNNKDFDHWAQLVKDTSWKYENVLQYFKKSEDFVKTNSEAVIDWEYHGTDGYLYTNHHQPSSNYTRMFLAATKELGINITDYNGKREVGSTILQLNTKDGRRFDQATAFLKPAAGRSNLLISQGSYVIKIEINNSTKRATGVIFTKDKKTYRAKIRKEIILSAGVFSSPHILMLSGVGPKEHLKRFNISVIQDLQVGSHLHETVYCGLPFSSNYTPQSKPLEDQIKDYLHGVGDLAAANKIDGALFYNTKLEPDHEYPDVEIVLSSSTPSALGQKFQNINNETWNALYNHTINGPFSLTVLLLKSRSQGTARLKSSSPYDYPLINLNLLTDPGHKDIDTIYEGIQFVLNLTKTNAFQSIAPVLEVKQLPTCANTEFLSKNFWYCYIRTMGMAAYHPAGTCPTGTDPKEGAVVDRNFNVYGLKKLRVADASIFPFTFAGHPNAPCTMIGEKISEVLKYEYRA